VRLRGASAALAVDRLQELPDGRWFYELKSRWRDDTTHLMFDALELIGRRTALIPPAHRARSGWAWSTSMAPRTRRSS
jgi:hypothetical protein